MSLDPYLTDKRSMSAAKINEESFLQKFMVNEGCVNAGTGLVIDAEVAHLLVASE